MPPVIAKNNFLESIICIFSKLRGSPSNEGRILIAIGHVVTFPTVTTLCTQFICDTRPQGTPNKPKNIKGHYQENNFIIESSRISIKKTNFRFSVTRNPNPFIVQKSRSQDSRNLSRPIFYSQPVHLNSPQFKVAIIERDSNYTILTWGLLLVESD